jgi:hypothetical protein
MSGHHFQLGQKVLLSLGPVQPGKFLVCEVVKLLPLEDGHPPKYQVRNSEENFDRRVSESDLSGASN